MIEILFKLEKINLSMKNKQIEYWTLTIISILSLITVVFTFINFHNVDILEARINTIYKSIKNFNEVNTFKEDFYLVQLGNNTNLILTVFAIFGSVIALFSISSFNFKVKNNEDNYARLLNEHKKTTDSRFIELSILKIEILNLKYEYKFEIRQLKSGDIVSWHMYTLEIIELLRDISILYKSIENDELSNKYFYDFRMTLKDLAEEEFLKGGINLDLYNPIIYRLRVSADTDIHHLLDKLVSNLNNAKD